MTAGEDVARRERIGEAGCVDGSRVRVSTPALYADLGEHVGHVDVVLYRRGSDLVAVVELQGYAVGNDALEALWLRTASAAILGAEVASTLSPNEAT